MTHSQVGIKSGQGIKKFTATSIVFEDDTTIDDADLVIFATGYGDNRVALRKCMGDKVADQLTPLWGLSAHLTPALPRRIAQADATSQTTSARSRDAGPAAATTTSTSLLYVLFRE